MEIVATAQTEFETVRIDEGLYVGTLKEIRDKKTPGEYGDQVVVVFDVLPKESGKEPVELATVAYKKLTPNSRLTEIFRAFGWTFKDGEKVDTSQFIGKQTEVFVEDFKKNDGDVASRITKVKPLQSEPQPGASPATPAKAA